MQPPAIPVGDHPRSALRLDENQLLALLRFNQALGGLRDREALLAAVARGLTGLAPADCLMAMIRSAKSAAFTAHRVPEGVKLFEETDDTAAVAHAWVGSLREPLVIAPEQLQQIWQAGELRRIAAGMHSAVLLPLAADGQNFGVVALTARSATALEGCPPLLLAELRDSVSRALDNCAAYAQQERRRRESEVLLHFNSAIGAHLDRDELFGAVAASLRRVVPMDRFGIEIPISDNRLRGHLLTPLDDSVAPTVPHVLPAPGTVCDWVLQTRQVRLCSRRNEVHDEFPTTFQVMTREGMESLLALPLLAAGRSIGVLFFMAAERGIYGDLDRTFLERVATAVAVALDDCLAHEEVRQLRDQLAAENVYLREEIQDTHNFEEIVGSSAALTATLRTVERVAATDTTVLLLGETGTGKELIARAIHSRSTRQKRPLVKVNCGAIPAGLIESELFGHVRGAFTGALQARTGRFELANGGTLFLDEIGELALDMQVKLLRALQEQEFEPVGSNRTVKVDVRVIAATNRELEHEVKAGRFRADLFYRLNVLPIVVPPLRDRSTDIPQLAYFFLGRHAKQVGRDVRAIDRESLDRLVAYDWPGNVRELENVIERSLILATGPILHVGREVLPAAPVGRTLETSVLGNEEAPAIARTPATLAAATAHPSDPSGTRASSGVLEDVVRAHIIATLQRTGGVIEGPHGAARLLDMHPNTLRSRLKKLGISPGSLAAT
jgi:formate hydrogenlyase transcriptional activator